MPDLVGRGACPLGYPNGRESGRPIRDRSDRPPLGTNRASPPPNVPLTRPARVGELCTHGTIIAGRVGWGGWFGLAPQPEPSGLHRRQELLGDWEPRGVADHRVNPAARAECRLPVVGPLPDVL